MKAAIRSVNAGLSMRGNLGVGLSYMKFEPSIGIAAGRIDKLGIDIRSFREPLTRAVRKVMMPSIEENFNSGGRPSWPPWSENTIRIREAFGWSGGDVLVRTGALREGASSFKVWTITTTSATIRDLPENIWYGKVHQAGFGGTGGAKGVTKSSLGKIQAKQLRILAGSGEKMAAGGVAPIPARPFLMFQPEDEDAVNQIFVDWLEERMHRAFAGWA